MMLKNPIGIFDSGYGGLTILKEIVHTLPEYDYLYLGDSARAPYGTQSFEKVYEYTLQAVNWFFSQGCSLVILACNTASAKALRNIQQKDLPILHAEKRVLGVIRPTSEVIGNYTTSKHVAVLGTTGTVQSNSYLIEIEKFFPNVVVSQEACPEWVSLVEENKMDTQEADYFVKQHIESVLGKDNNIDTLLLACTHYPLLIDKIKQHTPEGISIISQGNIVAESLKNYLERHPNVAEKCSRGQSRKFYTTGDSHDFNSHASLFFGDKIAAEKLELASS